MIFLFSTNNSNALVFVPKVLLNVAPSVLEGIAGSTATQNISLELIAKARSTHGQTRTQPYTTHSRPEEPRAVRKRIS